MKNTAQHWYRIGASDEYNQPKRMTTDPHNYEQPRCPVCNEQLNPNGHQCDPDRQIKGRSKCTKDT